MNYTNIFYVLASVLFILGIKKLSHPKTARNGNFLSACGMFIAIVSTLIANDDIDNKQFVQQEELFETVAISTTTPNAPSRPPITARGEMYDGYEGIEYPVGSGKWFYRDPESGAWIDWR